MDKTIKETLNISPIKTRTRRLFDSVVYSQDQGIVTLVFDFVDEHDKSVALDDTYTATIWLSGDEFEMKRDGNFMVFEMTRELLKRQRWVDANVYLTHNGKVADCGGVSFRVELSKVDDYTDGQENYYVSRLEALIEKLQGEKSIDLTDYLKKSELDLSGYAKKSEIPKVDLSDYVKKSDSVKSVRTDVAWAKAMGKPLGDPLPKKFDSNRYAYVFTVNPDEVYKMDFDFMEGLTKSIVFNNYGGEYTFWRETIYDNSGRASYQGDQFVFKINKDNYRVTFESEDNKPLVVMFKDSGYERIDLIPIDTKAPTQFKGFTTTKTYDDLSYPYMGFRQTDGEISQNPSDYNWVKVVAQQ